MVRLDQATIAGILGQWYLRWLASVHFRSTNKNDSAGTPPSCVHDYCGSERSNQCQHLRLLPSNVGDKPTSFSPSLTRTSWQAVVYYKYSDDITFKPFGLDTSPEPSVDKNTPDVHFQGYPCSMKEAYHLATKVSIP